METGAVLLSGFLFLPRTSSSSPKSGVLLDPHVSDRALDAPERRFLSLCPLGRGAPSSPASPPAPPLRPRGTARPSPAFPKAELLGAGLGEPTAPRAPHAAPERSG